MSGIAAIKIAFPRRVRRLFLPGLLALLAIVLMMCGDTGRAGSAARTEFISARSCPPASVPSVPASPDAIQTDAFVWKLADATRLSSLQVGVPPILPPGTFIQGYDVPRVSGVHVAVVDITRNCDLYAPRVIQIHESDTNPSLPPAISAEFKRLTIGGKHVGMLSGNNAGIYVWDGNGLSYWLTDPSYDVIPQSQVEQLIAALP